LWLSLFLVLDCLLKINMCFTDIETDNCHKIIVDFVWGLINTNCICKLSSNLLKFIIKMSEKIVQECPGISLCKIGKSRNGEKKFWSHWSYQCFARERHNEHVTQLETKRKLSLEMVVPDKELLNRIEKMSTEAELRDAKISALEERLCELDKHVADVRKQMEENQQNNDL
jgi:hypothetical protein